MIGLKMTYLSKELSIYADIELLCGSIAEFDKGSGIGHRCTTCGAVIGSIAEPRRCRALREEDDAKKRVWEVLTE
jgi:hypothetical protein